VKFREQESSQNVSRNVLVGSFAAEFSMRLFLDMSTAQLWGGGQMVVEMVTKKFLP